MKEMIIKNKQKYLEDNYPFKDTIKLTDKKRCIHCNQIITGGAIKLTKKMQDRKHMQDELDKLEMIRNFLILNKGEHLFVYL